MSAHHGLSRRQIIGSDGNPVVGARLRFYNAGTSLPRTVYKDKDLTVAHEEIIYSEQLGYFPTIFIPTGLYKERLEDKNGSLIYEQDNLEAWLGTGSGALPILSGGTGATTASAARVNIGAATQSDLDQLTVDLSDIQTTVNGLGDVSTYDLLPLNKIEYMASSVVKVAFAEVGGAVTIGTETPYDGTIPQITEGTEILSTSYTPKKSGSKLYIEAVIPCNYGPDGSGAQRVATCALHIGGESNAVAAGTINCDAAKHTVLNVFLSAQYTTSSTSSLIISIRVGVPALSGPTLLVNSAYGGSLQKTTIKIQEVVEA